MKQSGPIDADSVWRDIAAIRSEAPLVHNITNYVVMNTTANALLAAGASPVMAHAVEEVRDMVGFARALVLNIGTLSEKWVEAMVAAGREASRRKIPIVLDPVGAGATPYRTDTAARLLREAPPAIIRGNASEIRALASLGGGTKGVDSVHSSAEAVAAAQALAAGHHCVVSVSGETDMIVGAGAVVRVFNGHPMMPRVTGLGCTASALTGAFAAVNPDPLQAAAHAMVLMGIAGEIAADRSAGPGSLQMHLIDVLATIQAADIRQRIRVEEA